MRQSGLLQVAPADAGRTCHSQGGKLTVLAPAESVIRTDQGELFPLTTPMSELGMLGTGVGLYFNFVRYATAGRPSV